MFQTKVVEKIKTHSLYSVTCSRKSCRSWDKVGKVCRTGQATNDNIIRRMRFACWITMATDTHPEYALCMLDNYGYRHTPRICIIFAFFTAAMVTRTGFNVAFTVHCLSCVPVQIFTYFRASHVIVAYGADPVGPFTFVPPLRFGCVAHLRKTRPTRLYEQINKNAPQSQLCSQWATCSGVCVSHHQSHVKRMYDNILCSDWQSFHLYCWSKKLP